MFYFKQSNSVKQVLALEMVGITYIFPKLGFIFVVSIVYIVPHYKVLFKRRNLDHKYSKCLLSMSEGRNKNQIICYNVLIPDLLQ